MLVGINHLPCKSVYFLLYTCGEMGCELEISRAEGLDFCFCLNGNNFSFFFFLSTTICSIQFHHYRTMANFLGTRDVGFV